MKRIAFVDRCGVEPEIEDNLMDRRRAEENKEIIMRLGVRHDVVPYGKLCEETCRRLREDSAREPYDTIITHVPYIEEPIMYVQQRVRQVGDTTYIEGGYNAIYTSSLLLLKSLSEEFPETKIIAYTGAGEIDLPDRVLRDHGVTHILRRVMPLGESGIWRDMGRLRLLV